MRIGFHWGYAVAAAGYVMGILMLSSSAGEVGWGIADSSITWNLLHVPLFAGLASCLLLTFSGGQWSRRLSWGAYVGIVLLALLVAAADEWRQGFVPGRYGTLSDFLLNSVGVGGLVVFHWLGGGGAESSRTTARRQ
jgi:hypothetical protein